MGTPDARQQSFVLRTHAGGMGMCMCFKRMRLDAHDEGVPMAQPVAQVVAQPVVQEMKREKALPPHDEVMSKPPSGLWKGTCSGLHWNGWIHFRLTFTSGGHIAGTLKSVYYPGWVEAGSKWTPPTGGGDGTWTMPVNDKSNTPWNMNGTFTFVNSSEQWMMIGTWAEAKNYTVNGNIVLTYDPTDTDDKHVKGPFLGLFFPG